MPTTPVTTIGTTTATATNNKIATTETTKIVETTSNVTTVIQHALSSKGKKATNTQEASDDRSQHTTNHSESDDEIFALEEKRNINTNDQNIITKQDYVPEIAISVLADVVAKRYKYLRALIDSGSSSSIICESSMPDPIKKKIKHDPSGETKWTTKGGTYINRDAKSASYDIILGRDAMKELQFDLLYSENVPKIQFEQEVEIDCKPRGFWSRSHHKKNFKDTGLYTIVTPSTSPHPTPLERRYEGSSL
jgi:hypothetical protein